MLTEQFAFCSSLKLIFCVNKSDDFAFHDLVSSVKILKAQIFIQPETRVFIREYQFLFH